MTYNIKDIIAWLTEESKQYVDNVEINRLFFNALLGLTNLDIALGKLALANVDLEATDNTSVAGE